MKWLRMLAVAWATTLLIALLIPQFRSHLRLATLWTFGAQKLTLMRDSAEIEETNPKFPAGSFRAALDEPTLDAPDGLTQLIKLAAQAPNERGLQACLLERGIPVNPVKVLDQRWIKRAEFTIATAVRMQAIEPDNWFWRVGEVNALHFLGRDSEARATLLRQPPPTKYNSYTEYQTNRLTQEAANDPFGIVDIQRLQFVDGYARHQPALIRAAIKSYLGKAEIGPQDLRIAVSRLALAMFWTSDDVFDVLVGKALLSISVAPRPLLPNRQVVDSGTEAGRKQVAAQLITQRIHWAQKFSDMVGNRMTALELTRVRGALLASPNVDFLDASPSPLLQMGQSAYGALLLAAWLALTGLLFLIKFRMPVPAPYIAPILVFVAVGAAELIQTKPENFLNFRGQQDIPFAAFVAFLAILSFARGLRKFKDNDRWLLAGLVVVSAVVFPIFGVLPIAATCACFGILGLTATHRIRPVCSAVIGIFLLGLTSAQPAPVLTVLITSLALLLLAMLSEGDTVGKYALTLGLLFFLGGLGLCRVWDQTARAQLAQGTQFIGLFRVSANDMIAKYPASATTP